MYRLQTKIVTDKVKDDDAVIVIYIFTLSIAPLRKPVVVLLQSNENVRAILMLANWEKMPVTVMPFSTVKQHDPEYPECPSNSYVQIKREIQSLPFYKRSILLCLWYSRHNHKGRSEGLFYE